MIARKKRIPLSIWPSRLTQQAHRATALTVLLISISWLWLFFRIGGEATTLTVANLLYPLCTLLGLSGTLFTAYRARFGTVRLERSYQLAWLLIGLGQLSNLLGAFIYGYLHYLLGDAFPLPSETFFLLFYPLVFAGLMYMPTTIRFRTRMALDTLIITLSLLGLSWFFIISPLYTGHISSVTIQPERIRLLTAIAYPCGDLLLILAIVLLIQRRAERILHSSFFIIGLGITANIVGDSLFAYVQRTASYHLGTFYIDPFWYSALLLIGLAGMHQYAALAQHNQFNPTTADAESASVRAYERPGRVRRYLLDALIYIPLFFLLCITIYETLYYPHRYAPYLVGMVVLLTLLLGVRYLLAAHENEVLLQEREERHHASERLRLAMTQLTDELVMAHLPIGIVALATTELRFDAALLFLHEGQSPDHASRLLAYAASASSPTTQWQFMQADQLQRIALSGKPWELRPHEQADLPKELYDWCSTQQVQQLEFLPITYHDKTLGSLGVLCSNAMSRQSRMLLHSYIEQVASLLMHAYLYRQLQEVDQMKDHFMVTASHELRTPLTAVQGYIELLAQFDEDLPPAQRREFLQKARLGCEELSVMLGNVMDASRLELNSGMRPALLQPVEMHTMIESVLILIEPQLKRDERPTSIQIPPNLSVQADPVRLRQILMNICTNALKYSPRQTPLYITARIADNTTCALISIADKGKGIDPSEQERVFQRFYRLESDINSPIRGTGLGLYISRCLVEAMHGKLWIESSGIAGEGSIFHIQLPLAS